MKYIVTNHAKKRRGYSEEYSEEFLIQVMKILNEKIDFKKYTDKKIKVTRGRNKGMVVLLIEKTEAILITFMEFIDYNKLEIIDVTETNKIYRTNFVGRSVVCGKYTFSGTEYNVKLKGNLTNKFKIPGFIKKSTVKKLLDCPFIYYNEKLKYYMLKDYERLDAVNEIHLGN